ncbi:MAG: MATE family efflux transporter [Brevinematales bacterium]|nr:MATE family efflux transporter [Brevinematales bacterium]
MRVAWRIPWREYERVVRLAIPVMAGFLAFHVLGVVDVVMVGRLGREALAAVGLANTLFFFLIAPIEGFLGAALIVLPALVAQKAITKLRTAVETLTIVSLALGMVVFASFPFLSWYLGTMSSDETVLRLAREYLFIRVVGGGVWTVSLLWYRVFLALEKNMLVAVFSYLVVGINIVGNWLLIFGVGPFPALGVRGAAFATLFAQVVNVVLMVGCGWQSLVNKEKGSFFSWSFVKEFTRVGWPMGMTYLIEIVAWTLFVTMIAKLGTMAVAVHEIALKIKDISLLLGIAVANVITQQVSFFVGQSKPEEACRVVKRGAELNAFVMGVIGVAYWFFPGVLIGLVSQDKELVEASTRLLRFMALYQIADALFLSYRAGLEGLGKTALIRNVALVLDYFLWLPLAWVGIFLLEWGVIGAWVGLTCTVVVLAVVFFRVFFREVWKTQPPLSPAVSMAEEELR